MKLKFSLRYLYSGIIVLFLGALCLGTLTNYYTPYSGRAFLEYGMAPVFSQVNGIITEVYQPNNTFVKKNTPLLKLDDRNFRAELLRLEALYETTANQLESLDFQIQEARENLKRATATAAQQQSELARDEKLFAGHAISAKNLEQSQLNLQVAIQDKAAIEAHISALTRQRGGPRETNSELKRIRSEITIAQNNLDNTVIRASIDGILSSHQLYPGQAVSTNEKYAVIHEVNNAVVNVDLMEKSSRHLKTGQKVLIAFDAIPGELFPGHIAGFVRELDSAYTAPNRFTQISEDTRWIRATGRTRIQVTLDQALPAAVPLATGAKSAVTFQNSAHPLLSFLMRCFIRVISQLNYIY